MKRELTDSQYVLETLMMAYRKHCMEDDSIGWDELGDRLFNSLCLLLGDDGFIKWKERISKKI
jgi:hypothetical protein